MFDKVVEKLNKIKEDIDTEMSQEMNEERISYIQAKLAYFTNYLINNEQLFISEDFEENKNKRKKYNYYKSEISKYKNIIMTMQASQNTKQQDNIEEFNENTTVVPEDRFLEDNTRRVNNYIMSAIDSLESLKKQRMYIDNTRERIKDGLAKIGMSKTMVEKISSRYLTDYYFFWAGVAVVVILIIIIKLAL